MMKVLLMDDHSLFVSGLEALLQINGITVVGTARDSVEAVMAAKKFQPDVILMDIHMSGCNGLATTRLIKAKFPKMKIVMLILLDEDHLVFEAIRSGVSGFLLKNLETKKFLTMLEEVVRGKIVFSPGLADHLLQELIMRQNDGNFVVPVSCEKVGNLLTPRQKEVLAHIAHGQTYKEVAAALNISGNTVKYHMNEIMERLHLENRGQAIAYAIQSNLTAMYDLDEMDNEL